MAERFAAHLKDLRGPSVGRSPSLEKRCFKAMVWLVRKIKSNPSIQLLQAKALQHAAAKYPLRHVAEKRVTAPMKKPKHYQEKFVFV